ncbi:MAG: hypothetical protein ABEJ90_04025 [Halobacterium sp.]
MDRDLPLVATLREFGGEDPVFDAFILAGPLVVSTLAAVGRNAATTALAAGYLLSFCAYVAAKWVRGRPP